jgi:hypothetical protein
MTAGNLSAAWSALIGRLLERTPDCAGTEEGQHAVEHELVAALAAGGCEPGEALIGSTADHGHQVARVKPCLWRVELRPPRARIMVQPA